VGAANCKAVTQELSCCVTPSLLTSPMHMHRIEFKKCKDLARFGFQSNAGLNGDNGLGVESP